MTGARQYSPGNVNKRWVKPAPVAGRERPLLSRGAGQEARTASTWLGALSTCVQGGLAKSRRWRNGGVRAGAAEATEERGPLSARPPPRRTAGRGPQALGSARSPLPGWRTSAGAGEARPQAAAPPLARSLALPLRRRRGDSAELSECARAAHRAPRREKEPEWTGSERAVGRELAGERRGWRGAGAAGGGGSAHRTGSGLLPLL